MAVDNFIDFDLAERRKPVFRVFTYSRFVETLATRALTLVRPKLWDDPFENFILQAKFRLPSGKVVRLSASRLLYGQCWSRTKESDAMWRIYAPAKNGVKARSTPIKLSQALEEACVSRPDVRSFVGKVHYLSRLKLHENLAKKFNVNEMYADSQGREHAKSLLVKRKAFEHEQEIRLICRHSIDIDDDVIHLPVDPVGIFDEVILDPRMTVAEYDRRRAQLIALGYPADRIKRSGLYGDPDLIFDIAK